MDATSLFKIIENTDCDLTNENIIKEHLPRAKIKFDPNHYAKKDKKIIYNF